MNDKCEYETQKWQICSKGKSLMMYFLSVRVSVVGYGSWFEHVQEFWEHRMDSNVLFLKYEDMYKVPPHIH